MQYIIFGYLHVRLAISDQEKQQINSVINGVYGAIDSQKGSSTKFNLPAFNCSDA